MDLSNGLRIAWAVLTGGFYERFRGRLNFQTIVDVKLSTELTSRFGACRLVRRETGMTEERRSTEEGGQVGLGSKQPAEKGHVLDRVARRFQHHIVH